jgi:hypothetical protein
MRFLYWREESRTIEATLWFTMQQTYNMRADFTNDSFLSIRPSLFTDQTSADAYLYVNVRNGLLNMQWRKRIGHVTNVAGSSSSDWAIDWPNAGIYTPRGYDLMSDAQTDHWVGVI